MPARLWMNLGVPAGSRSQVSYTDVHRLACYLVEPPRARDHRLQVKPFSVWPPMVPPESADDSLPTAPNTSDLDIVELRVAWLAPSAPPVRRVHDRLRTTPHLGDDVPVVPLGLEVDEVTFADLAATTPTRRVEVEFLTPTVFSRNGRHYPLPDPVLALRGLHQRWLTLAEPSAPATGREAIPDASGVEAALGAVVVEQFDGHTSTVEAPTRRSGFTGSATFALRDPTTPAAEAAFAALWAFAGLAGVGRSTTYGLGAVEVTHA